jgi:hypothetical protein
VTGRRPAAVAALACAVSLLLAAPALARSERTVAYPYERVWPAAIRFLRIDAGYAVREKDADAGYILFDVEEEGRTFPGALELVRGHDDRGRHTVKLILRIEDRPSYMETGLLDRLRQKLRRELGPPPPPPEHPKAGDDDDDGGGDADG